MTHIYLILGNEPERDNRFTSVHEVYDKIEARLEPNNRIEKANYFRKEILDTFDKNIEWMSTREILTFDSKDKLGLKGSINIDKEKLVECIVDPGLPLST